MLQKLLEHKRKKRISQNHWDNIVAKKMREDKYVDLEKFLVWMNGRMLVDPNKRD